MDMMKKREIGILTQKDIGALYVKSLQKNCVK